MSIEKIINEAWEKKDQVNQNSDQTLKDAINQVINDEHFGKMDSDKDYISHKIENLSLFLKEIRLLKSK